MTIKKVTVEDLKNIQGGEQTKGRGKVKRGEKIATKSIIKEEAEKLKIKNSRTVEPVQPGPKSTLLP